MVTSVHSSSTLQEEKLDPQNLHLNTPEKEKFTSPIVWRNVFIYTVLHLVALHAMVFILPKSNWMSIVFTFFYGYLSLLGITVGVHRLWSHRSYKAKLPLRIFLGFCQTAALQNSILDWARDHRVHHKYSETNADPHNATRGFFFSHIGWLLVRKHPEIKEKGKAIDLSDLKADPVVHYQEKYYVPLFILCAIIIPIAIPMFYWGESFKNAFLVCFVFRYVYSLHCTWLVNSVAHIWGQRPYDININPRENKFVTLFAIGEGFHNYHHTFPWDYATSEWGFKLNFSTMFLNLMEKWGLAYELKKVTPEMIKQRIERTGQKHL